MTQAELGQRIGLSARGIQEIEAARTNPWKHVRAVAEATNVELDFLVHGTEPRPAETDSSLLSILSEIDARLRRIETAVDEIRRRD